MSLLTTIKTGRVEMPHCLLLFATEGVGKSTFGADAPKPIFIGAENNDELDVPRFPRCETWDQFNEQLDALKTEKHDYKTVVVDTLDSIEKLLHRKIISEDEKNAKTMAVACGGFGKAYELASEEFLKVRNKLDALRVNGMNIILLCHANKVKFDDALALHQYDTYEMKLRKEVNPLFREWVSTVLFANFIVHKTEGDNSRTYAVGIGERKMFTQKRPGHDGKNRFNLPYEMDLDWNTYEKSVADFFKNGGSEAQGLIEELKAEIETLKEKEFKEKASNFLDNAGTNMGKLNALKLRLGEFKAS